MSAAYSPQEAAEHLGIADQTLRRWARLYEAAWGDLPTDRRGRVYPLEALERMSGARDLLDAGKAATLEAAFQAAATGNDLATVPPVGVDLARQVIEGMGRLERRLSLIEAELQQDRTEANDLRRLVGYYRQELERRDAPPKPAPWWRAIWG